MAEQFELFGLQGALTAGRKQKPGKAPDGFLTLAFNDDSRLGPSPVSLSVLRVGCLDDGQGGLSPYRGGSS